MTPKILLMKVTLSLTTILNSQQNGNWKDFHDERLLIADFGLSKDETSKTSNVSVHGVQAYIDPQCFENVSYKCRKKSGIYSFGVILWEISSGRPLFQSLNLYAVIIHISVHQTRTFNSTKDAGIMIPTNVLNLEKESFLVYIINCTEE
ncbi:hypothetical protein C2G38_2037156 [Gigaspora rosea]|uniref:Protein kinase domain-containing protein n=1 Tax=Gigaspora rosea TaxID=44941 RepID=A0A397VFL7_9GLOM|nr:hypothetical protein C2G38_2037156 [Gigaspora rosea]